MNQKCPKCGYEYTDEDKCPICGFKIDAAAEDAEKAADSVEDSAEPAEEKVESAENTSETADEKAEPAEEKAETSENKNDDIQWSDYEEMPIGSVAELLNETLDDESETNGEDSETSEKAEEISEETGADQEDQNEEIPEASAEEGAESEEADEDEASAEEGRSENLILQQYMKEHRHDGPDEAEEPETVKEAEIKEADVSPEDAESQEEVSETEEKEVPAEDSVQPELAETSPQTDTSDEEVESETETAEGESSLINLDRIAEEVNKDRPLRNKPEEISEPEAEEEKLYKPLDLFVLDSEEGKASDKEQILRKEQTPDKERTGTEFTEFDDPNLEPLPSEDEEVAAKYAKEPEYKQAEQEKVEEIKAKPEEVRKAEEKSITRTSEPEKKKSKKWLYIGAAAAVLIGAGGYAIYQQNQQAKAEQEAVQKKTDQAVEKLQNELNDFFTDDSHRFIKTNMVSSDLTNFKKDIEKYKDEKGYDDLSAVYKSIETKIGAIEEVNGLFIAPVINGEELADNPLLKEDKEIIVEEQSGSDDFAKLLNEAVDQAKNQYKDLQTAKDKVAVLYKDGSVTAEATRENYDDAVSAVSAVRNQTLAAALKDDLTKVDSSLTEAEKAEEERIAAEEEAAAASSSTSSSAQQDSGTSGAGSNYSVGDGGALTGFVMNAEGNPIVSSDSSDIADTANSAWGWSAGIQETVVQKCIDRGYIIAGNYSLQPALIVDGQGFYNLYRGDGSYVVTINCKTGWFKGNGPGGPATRVN